MKNYLIKDDPVLNTTKRHVRVCEPLIKSEEFAYVNAALVDQEVSSQGQFVKLFAQEFARKMGCRYGIPVSSGFMALYLALRAVGVEPGDEVICPTFTMIATPNAIKLCGAIPIFVDCDKDGNLDPAKIEEKITVRTKGILPVHIYGKSVDFAPIKTIADFHKLWIIEDAAEAHGATYMGQKIGSLGDMACFSFYANKIITTGEGGIITTNSKQLAETASNLRDYAFTDGRHFWHQHFALNGRMSNLEAAVGLGQLKKIGEFIEARRRWAEAYQDLEDLDIFVEKYSEEDVCWMAGIRLKDQKERDEFRAALAEEGIETRTYFIPCHIQPIYYTGESFPVSEELSKVGLYLPTYNYFTKDKSRYIIKIIRNIWQKKKQQ